MKSFLTRPIAHRGLHNNIYPENSTPAINKAAELNFPTEIDVHLTKDNKLYVFHDDNLKRMTGADLLIKDLTSHELNKFRLNNTNYGIPSFIEVLKCVNSRVPLLIEIKKSGNPNKTAQILIENLKDYKGEYAVQSFYPDYLFAVRKLNKHIKRGQLATCKFPDSIPKIQRFASKNMLGNPLSNPNFISYDYTCLPLPVVSLYRKIGLPILGYTVRSKEEEKKARMYCDNIIFENYIPD